MRKEQEIFQISSSNFSLLPYSAFMPTSWTAEKAKEAGCSSLEIAPLRKPVRELLVAGKLSCEPRQVSSGHREWTPYITIWQVLNRMRGLHGPSHIDVLIFPNTEQCIAALKKLENLYHVPIVTAIPDDRKLPFSKPPILEVYDGLALTTEKIKARVKREDFSGVCLDTDHLGGKVLGPWEKVLEELLPIAQVVHFHPKDREELEAVIGSGYNSTIGRIMRRVKESGYNKLVTVELDGRIVSEVFGLSAILPHKLQEHHKAVVEFIKNV